MAFFDWKDEMSVNVKEIDLQHQALVNLMNGLYDAMKAGKGNTIIGKLIADLLKYTEVHFSAEEKYFEMHSYPETDIHKAEHKKFIDQALAVQQDFNDGKIGLSLSVMNFLKKWLSEHIMGTDKKYAQFFNDKGLQ